MSLGIAHGRPSGGCSHAGEARKAKADNLHTTGCMLDSAQPVRLRRSTLCRLYRRCGDDPEMITLNVVSPRDGKTRTCSVAADVLQDESDHSAARVLHADGTGRETSDYDSRVRLGVDWVTGS